MIRIDPVSEATCAIILLLIGAGAMIFGAPPMGALFAVGGGVGIALDALGMLGPRRTMDDENECP